MIHTCERRLWFRVKFKEALQRNCTRRFEPKLYKRPVYHDAQDAHYYRIEQTSWLFYTLHLHPEATKPHSRPPCVAGGPFGHNRKKRHRALRIFYRVPGCKLNGLHLETRQAQCNHTLKKQRDPLEARTTDLTQRGRFSFRTATQICCSYQCYGTVRVKRKHGKNQCYQALCVKHKHRNNQCNQCLPDTGLQKQATPRPVVPQLPSTKLLSTRKNTFSSRRVRKTATLPVNNALNH